MAERRILHYRIIGRLGAGGMGEVLLAQDERLGRRVALKFLPPGGMGDPDRAERLHREARSLASLNHPGIAAIHALETAEDRPFLVMEYVEGETLADRIARRPLPIDEVIRVGRAVAEALAHAHARSVIHRDVKPANILVTPDGTTKLADFGLALLAHETRLTADGLVSGTPYYMSPEQAAGGDVDARTDFFSLGAVLYEALTGRRPFDASVPDAVLHAIRSREPEPPTALRTGIPLELERIVLKCLRKDPALRYQHAADLAADLRALESGSGATQTVAAGGAEPAGAAADSGAGGAGPGGAGGPGGGSRRTRPRLPRAAIAGAVIIGIAALLYVGSVARRSGRPAPGNAEASTRGIAVLSFQNLADPEDPNREALIAASLLTVGLGQAQEIPVLGAQRVQDVMRSMNLSAKSVGRTEALEVGRRAGATYVVTGYVVATSPDVVLAAEVASTRDGSLLTASRVRAPGGAEGLFAAVDSLTASLRGGLRQAGLAVTDRAVDVAKLTTRNPAAYRAYIRGMEELNRLRLEEARRAFRSAIAADSLFALARYYAAIAEWWANDFDAAQEEVTRALALGKSLSGREREGLRGIDALIHWDFERAAAIYRELLARYPDDKEFLYGLGEAAFHSERYDEAEPVLQRAVALDPTFGVAYYHLVDIAVERRDLPGALAQVAAYGRIDPAGPEALRLEANARGLLGDTDGAIAALNRLVERDPEDGSALFQLAVTHAWRGEFREAEESTARLRRVSPEESIRGADEAELMLLWAKGRPREMERLAAARIAEADRSATFYRIMLTYHRIRALVALKRYPEALQTARDVRGAIESLIPARNPTLPMTVQILLYMRRFDEAEKLLTEYGRSLERGAIQRERQARDHVAGLIALAKGRYREAVPLLRRGKPAGPAASRLWLHRWALARACLKAGEREQGLDLLRDMVKSGEYITLPEDVFAAHLLLARTLEEQGKRAEALALYRRVERQYREAEPDLPELQEARAGARRLQGSAAGAS